MSPRERETLPVVRAADLEELDPARRWLIEPLWIHAGVGTIGGLPKSCKSWLGLDMAVSVASGTPCLDTFPVRDPGGVLLYMAEDAGSLVKARLRGLCRHRGLDLNSLPIDVITAPVISDGTVYFTTFGGTSYALNAADGSLVWVKANAATSAPVVSNGQLYETRKGQAGKETVEGLARVDAKKGEAHDRELLAASAADYLKAGNGGGVGLATPKVKELDSSVGFAVAPGSANLMVANDAVGVNSVVGAWAYQGSHAALSKGQILNAQGKYINSVRASDGKQSWQREVVNGRSAAGGQVFSPPAVGRDYLYLAGAAGYLLSVRQSDGGVGFSYAMNAPIAFQPALAKGNVYAGTSDGRLICLKTGNKDADGWYAWGGNAQHNKVQ